MEVTTTNEQELNYVIARPIGERVSVLETQQDAMEAKLDAISEKLDDLLSLKYKGMGAIKLVSMLFVGATGLAGFVAFLLGLFDGKS